MGATLSYDFCGVVRNLLLQKDVDLNNDHDTWRTIFCTDMSDRDIKMYLNWNAVRLMRRNKPHNLAALIYRCMQQMAAFLDKATSPGSSVVHRDSAEKTKHEEEMNTKKQQHSEEGQQNDHQSSSSSSASAAVAVDPCAVRNAIRILIQILPCIYETEIVVEQTEKPAFLDLDDDDDDFAGSARLERGDDDNNNTQDAGGMGGPNNKHNHDNSESAVKKRAAALTNQIHREVRKKKVDELVDKLLALPESLFASSFAESFFKYNLMCDAKNPSIAFSPILAENAKRAKESGWDRLNNANPSTSTSLLPVCLGDELVNLLTRVCFIPGFSVEVGGHITSGAIAKYLRGYSNENASCGYDVVAELLDGDGLFTSSTTISLTNSTSSDAAMVPPTPVSEESDNKSSSSSSNQQQNQTSSSVASSSYSTKIYNSIFSFDVLHNRIDLLRCLQLCLSKNVMIGRTIIDDGSDWMRDCFQDSRKNPLSLTLLISCLNFIATYVSRGVVPYSSHYFADVPEKMLSTCVEFCCTALAFPPNAALKHSHASSSSSSSTTADSTSEVDFFLQAAANSRQTLWTALSNIFINEPTVAPFIISGLCSVLANPVYATTTSLRGSQRTIETANEAIVLLWFLCISPGTKAVALSVLSRAALESVDAPEKFGGTSVLMGLLRIVLRGLNERRFVADTQAALWVLLELTAEEDFMSSLSKKLGKGGCPLPTLETLNNSLEATQADALILSLCEITCSSAPRWLLSLSQLSISILVNVVSNVYNNINNNNDDGSTSSVILEITQFEIFHMLEWITSYQEKTSFLGFQRTSVDQDACLVGMVNVILGAVSCSGQQQQHFRPLVASLATEIRISDRLNEFVSRFSAADQEEEEGSETKPYRPGLHFRQQLFDNGKLEKFIQLEKIAIEKMNEETTAAGSSSSSSNSDPYVNLNSAIPFFEEKNADEQQQQQQQKLVVTLKPSDELLRWGISHSWAMTIQSNIETPLFDIMRAKMFS